MQINDIAAGPPRLVWFPIHVQRPVPGGTTRLAPGTALAPASAVEDQLEVGAALQAMMMVAMVMIMEPGLHLRRVRQRVRKNRRMRPLSGGW